MKNVKASPDVTVIETRRRKAMKAKPAVKPAPTDTDFFDLNPARAASPSDEFQDEFLDTICAAMLQTGIEPAIIHAFRKTGSLLTEENIHLFSEPELAEWNEAIDEFPLITRMIQ